MTVGKSSWCYLELSSTSPLIPCRYLSADAVLERLKRLFGLIDQLYAAGARNFMFFDLPPLDRSPAREQVIRKIFWRISLMLAFMLSQCAILSRRSTPSRSGMTVSGQTPPSLPSPARAQRLLCTLRGKRSPVCSIISQRTASVRTTRKSGEDPSG